MHPTPVVDLFSEPSENPWLSILFLIFAGASEVILYTLPAVFGYVVGSLGDSPANGIAISLFSLLHWFVPMLGVIAVFDIGQHIILWWGAKSGH